MSFWSGKKESLLQSLVEITFKALFSGIVIAILAQFIVSAVDQKIELTSKRDALNAFRNSQLNALTTRFSEAYSTLDCVRNSREAKTEECRSAVSIFLTELNRVLRELGAHYPDQKFETLIDLKVKGEAIRADTSLLSQADLDDFAAKFGDALHEMASNFK
ncbi:MAG: hypothetical protein ABJH45_06175 [Paracoccaceae bacterium]